MSSKSTIWSTGLAMFSMFFGAGNIVFPLALGQFTGDKTFYGVLGLTLTAVFVPLIGLLAMLLFQGDYQSFFKRIGKTPGALVILLILGLIGPLGAIPRCITISYATVIESNNLGWTGVSLPLFSAISCVAIFLFTFRPNKILSLLGYVLTPLLLLSLVVIILKGIWGMPHTLFVENTRWSSFAHGLFDGYNTMDLLASFFFSSAVLVCLRKEKSLENQPSKIFSTAVISSLIAAFLLAAIYASFSYLAAGYQESLKETPSHQLLGVLAYKLLGPWAGIVAGAVAAFACLTTEIALTAVFADFLQKTLCREKISYKLALVITLFASFMISILHFNGISAFLAPILQICYPALIILSILNLLHKMYQFQPVKVFFYGTVLITVGVHLYAKFLVV